MKNLVFVIVFAVFTFFMASCEAKHIDDEIGEQTELQGIEPGDDGSIDDDDLREGN